MLNKHKDKYNDDNCNNDDSRNNGDNDINVDHNDILLDGPSSSLFTMLLTLCLSFVVCLPFFNLSLRTYFQCTYFLRPS